MQRESFNKINRIHKIIFLTIACALMAAGFFGIEYIKNMDEEETVHAALKARENYSTDYSRSASGGAASLVPEKSPAWTVKPSVKPTVRPTVKPTAKVRPKDRLIFAKNTYKAPYDWKITIRPKIAIRYNGRPLTLKYTSVNPKIVSVKTKGNAGIIFGKKKGIGLIKVTARENRKIVACIRVSVQKEKRGLHTGPNGKKYFILKSGKRASGYKKIKRKEYYFSEKYTFAVCNKWRYVNVAKKKYKMYFGKDGRRVNDVSSLLSRKAKFLLDVNLTSNKIVVYASDGKRGYRIPVKAMWCSSGMPGHSTRIGTYRLSKAGRWHVLRYNAYGQYATRYNGPFLFHSVTYDRLGDSYSLQKGEFKKLGKSASHGCVRLMVCDAKWIYDNSSRCIARLYYGSKKARLPIALAKKLNPKKTKTGRFYDPTDPDVK